MPKLPNHPRPRQTILRVDPRQPDPAPSQEATDKTEKQKNALILADDVFSFESLSPALQELYGEMGIDPDGDQATVYVSKVDVDKDGNEANIWKGPPEEYDLEDLAKKFGSGQFRVRIYVKNATGRPSRMCNKLLGWMLTPEEERKRRAALENPQPAQNTTEFEIIMKQMLDQMHAMTAALTARPEPPNPLNTLQGIKEIAEIIRPAAAPADAGRDHDSFGKTMNAVKTFIEMSRVLSPATMPINGDGKLDVGGAALMRGLDILGRAIEQKTHAAAGNSPQASPAAADEKIAASPANSQAQAGQPSEEEQEQIMLMRIKLRQANRAAAANIPAAEFAGEIYNLLSPDDLFKLAVSPQWFEALCDINPDCAAHKAWYGLVRDALIQLARDDDILTPAPASHTVGNGNPSLNRPDHHGTESDVVSKTDTDVAPSS